MNSGSNNLQCDPNDTETATTTRYALRKACCNVLRRSSRRSLTGRKLRFFTQHGFRIVQYVFFCEIIFCTQFYFYLSTLFLNLWIKVKPTVSSQILFSFAYL